MCLLDLALHTIASMPTGPHTAYCCLSARSVYHGSVYSISRGPGPHQKQTHGPGGEYPSPYAFRGVNDYLEISLNAEGKFEYKRNGRVFWTSPRKPAKTDFPMTFAFTFAYERSHGNLNRVGNIQWVSGKRPCGGNFQTCTAASKPGSLAHGVMTGDPNGGVGSAVKYKCNANYKLVGSAERKCLKANSTSR